MSKGADINHPTTQVFFKKDQERVTEDDTENEYKRNLFILQLIMYLSKLELANIYSNLSLVATQKNKEEMFGMNAISP